MPTELSDLISENLSDNRPFVIYRKPGDSQVNLLVQSDSRLHHLQRYSETGFVMAPFSTTEKAIILFPDQFEQLDFETGPIEFEQPEPHMEPRYEDKNRYLNLLKDTIAAIQSGKLEKVVLARKIGFRIDGKPIHVFENLLQRHPNAFCYLWYHPSIGLWSGASPELLLSVENDSLTTYALAGTIEYQEGVEPNWTYKELEEQDLVTRYILDELAKISIQANASTAESILAGRLWHLRSVINARVMADMHDLIINSLHPTPAVCGIPLAAAERYIAENEGIERKYYCGFLGELNLAHPSHTELYVNLRCLEYYEDKAYVYVGGGITSRSLPLQEWQETEAKSQTILNAMFNYIK